MVDDEAQHKTPKSRRTSERILTAAVEAFFADTYDNTSVGQIAAAAGVANGTVLLHFESKSQLATAAFARRVARAVEEATTMARTGDPLDDLEAVVARLFAFYREHQVVATGLLQQALFTTGTAGRHYVATVEATIAAFASIVEAQTGKQNAQIVARGLLADYLLVLLQALRGDMGSPDELLAQFRALARTRLD